MANPSSFIHVLTLSLLFFTSMHSKGIVSASDAIKRLPAGATEYRSIETQAAGDPFQLCLDCKCCAADDPNNCSQMPCCYHIDCDLPDKPYGVCAFVPQSCDCTDCT